MRPVTGAGSSTSSLCYCLHRESAFSASPLVHSHAGAGLSVTLYQEGPEQGVSLQDVCLQISDPYRLVTLTLIFVPVT